MKIFFGQILSYFNGIARRMYWIYKASRIVAGKGTKIHWNVLVEGKGNIRFGNNVQINKLVQLGCGKNGNIQIGNDTIISKAVCIYSSDSVSFTLGRHSLIEENTRMYVYNDWEIGNKVAIATYCQIFSREEGCKGKFKVGDGTHIGDFSIIDLSADVFIAENVAIGPNCTIYTHDHNYKEPNLEAPWMGTAVTEPVNIESGAWIGANVTILPGVIIGKNAIVAAGAVVTQSVISNALYAGVPAKLIKTDIGK